jgi:hypothetical protein
VLVMSTSWAVRLSVIAGPILIPLSLAWGQTAPATTAADAPLPDAKLAFFRDNIGLLQVTVADLPDEPCAMAAKPLIKFDNPISQILDGYMFLWTDRGRPVAVVKSYNNASIKSWGRTFVSIAPQRLTMSLHGQDLWMPQAAGVSFAPLPEAPRPAELPAARLTQMRNLARRFTVIDHWGIKEPKDWTLRLLSSPLYRYEVPAEHVIDGAMFGYALTTAPEALVLLEVRETADGPMWYYAAARCTRFAVRFQLDDRPLAEFPRLDAWPATGTYFHHPVPMAKFPYEDDVR